MPLGLSLGSCLNVDKFLLKKAFKEYFKSVSEMLRWCTSWVVAMRNNP